MNTEKPLVLATNDDGIDSEFLRVLVKELVKEFECDHTVEERADEITARLQLDPSVRVEIENMSLREIYVAVTNYKRGRLDGALEGLV